MAIPELIYDEPNDTLIILGGNSGDPVTMAELVTVDPSGTFVQELLADAFYQVNVNIQIGDGTQAAYFASENESVYFTETFFPHIKSNATLRIGNVTGDYGHDGSFWSYSNSASFQNILQSGSTTANLFIYASQIAYRGGFATYFNGGNIIFKNVILGNAGGGGRFYFGASANDLQLEDIYINNAQAITLQESPSLSTNIHSHLCTYGIVSGSAGPEVTDLKITNEVNAQVLNGSSTATLKIINPKQDITTVINGADAGSFVELVYTVDLTILNVDSDPISDVTVQMTDSNGDDSFNVNKKTPINNKLKMSAIGEIYYYISIAISPLLN